MRRTIFDTPVVGTAMYWFARLYLRSIGWKSEGALPDVPKFVVIAAPHTTNWDMPITLALAFIFRVKVFWMGKDTLFKRPFGALMKWLGGIPINRSQTHNVVGQSIAAFEENRQLVMIIPPEGTRGRVRYWKTGFYHIAHSANVPIVLGYLDYARKVGGLGPAVYPTGDIAKDMQGIQEFYAQVTGKYPDKTGHAGVSSPGTRSYAHE